MIAAAGESIVHGSKELGTNIFEGVVVVVDGGLDEGFDGLAGIVVFGVVEEDGEEVFGGVFVEVAGEG